jgi:hypothetical protein
VKTFFSLVLVVFCWTGAAFAGDLVNEYVYCVPRLRIAYVPVYVAPMPVYERPSCHDYSYNSPAPYYYSEPYRYR